MSPVIMVEVVTRSEDTEHGSRGNATRRSYLKTIGAVGAVSGTTFIAGCTSDSGGGNGGGGTITLGAAVSQSGGLAEEGSLYTDAYEMTIADINEEDGVEVGDTNYEFDLKIYDDESDPARSRELYQRLIQQDNIDYLLGPYSSGVTLAARPIIESSGRPMVQAGGASTEIYTEDNEWMFGLLSVGSNYATTSMNLADTFSDPKVESVAIATENESFSQDARKNGAIPRAEELGWEVVVDEQFPTDTEDLTSILNAVGNNNPDVFLMLGHHRHATLVVNQMQQRNVNVPMVAASVGGTTPQYIEETGDTGNYMYGPSQWDSEADYDGMFYGSASEYVKRFEEEYDYSPDYHNCAASATLLVYLNAFKNVDSLDPSTVRDQVRSTDVMTCYGPISFKSNGQIDRDMVLYQWQENKKELVFPKDIARAEPVYPMPTWDRR